MKKLLLITIFALSALQASSLQALECAGHDGDFYLESARYEGHDQTICNYKDRFSLANRGENILPEIEPNLKVQGNNWNKTGGRLPIICVVPFPEKASWKNPAFCPTKECKHDHCTIS